jgi:YceI-like domain
VALAVGSHRLGSGDASLWVMTYREGVAARVGHDLVLAVMSWEATVEIGSDPAAWAVQLSADPRSLEVREGLHGVKPLTDKDRDEIGRRIEERVLRGRPIRFRSSSVRPGDGRLEVEGELTLAGATRPIGAQVDVDDDGNAAATVVLRQSDWGIKPYSGMFGALKVRDDVEIRLTARLPRVVA